ncbi:BCCT family transporter, partial [Bacillus cereus group sp. Bce039]
FVTLIAIISVVRGINGGVKVLSNINMAFALALLIFIISVSFNTTLQSIPTTFMAYVKNILPLSNPHGRDDEIWMHGWTVFYWAW